MSSGPAPVVRMLFRSSKRIAVTVIGGGLLLAGLAMLVLPGPGILVVALGFAVLATEYVWASAALDRIKRAADQAGRFARQRASGRTQQGATSSDSRKDGHGRHYR